MTVLHDRLPNRPGLPKIWRGIIASNPVDLAHKVNVIIEDIDPDLVLGPCRWQSRDAVSLPSRGDDCLVIFDNDNEPWVVVWWPF